MSGAGTASSETGVGVSGEHITLPAPPALIAPTISGKDRNTIKTSFVPFACWRADDARFEFDSSFIRPEVNTEVTQLKSLIDRHTLPDQKGVPSHKPVLTVFGHADPTGNDEFNKVLSGRRAQAVYALLTRDVDLWEDLFSNPHGGDVWDPGALTRMLEALGREKDPLPSGAAARKSLYRDYMDHVCTLRGADGAALKGTDGEAARLVLVKTDFLSAGTDRRGKGDYQGCGEFNPIMLFSQEEDQEFSKKENKSARDDQNSANRRVLILLFRPGVHVKPADWPCPAAKDGTAACKKRFWSDGEKRRSDRLPGRRRRFEETEDTFACRFYQRLVTRSPCESERYALRVMVHNRFGIPRKRIPVRVTYEDGFSVNATTDDRGLVVVPTAPGRVTAKITYDCRDEEPHDIVESRPFFIDLRPIDTEDGLRRRLHNLGYVVDDDLAAGVRLFQTAYGLRVTGKGDKETTDRLAQLLDLSHPLTTEAPEAISPIPESQLLREGETLRSKRM